MNKRYQSLHRLKSILSPHLGHAVKYRELLTDISDIGIMERLTFDYEANTIWVWLRFFDSKELKRVYPNQITKCSCYKDTVCRIEKN